MKALTINLPTKVSLEAQATLEEMRVALPRNGSAGARLVVSDDIGWASILLDPDGTIDHVEWGAH